MKKIITILGTRPEIIRLSRVIPQLDKHCHHLSAYTGQNYTTSLKDIFFHEMDIRKPDIDFGICEKSISGQVAQIFIKTEELLKREKPDGILILGDTNSGLSAFIAKRMGIKVYHMEAGNRCFDDVVPEEINRRVIDHCSDVLMPYTNRSRDNLIREGVPTNRIYVTGNPINDVLSWYSNKISVSTVLSRLKIQQWQYILTTVHRAENVDNPDRLLSIIESLVAVGSEFGKQIIVSVHPRTRERINKLGVNEPSILFLDPFGFFDFVQLEREAFCVITDSGTVQEECCILKVPNITIRDNTERPETIEAGSNMLVGVSKECVCRGVEVVTENHGEFIGTTLWNPPSEYENKHVSLIVSRIVLGK